MTQVARKGEWVKLLWYKGRLRTLSSVSKSRKFAHHLEDTQQETSTLGVLHSVRFSGSLNISRRGLSSCLF